MMRSALWKTVYACVFAELLLRYGGSTVYISHMARDAADAAVKGAS